MHTSKAQLALNINSRKDVLEYITQIISRGVYTIRNETPLSSIGSTHIIMFQAQKHYKQELLLPKRLICT